MTDRKPPSFGGLELSAVVIAGVMMVTGLILLIAPQDVIVPHATTTLRAKPAMLIEHVRKPASRFYALSALLGGAGIATFVLLTRNTGE